MMLTGASDELPPVEPPRPTLVPLPTWTWKTPVSVAPRPSCTVYWIESLPCQPATGVYLMVPSEPNDTERSKEHTSELQSLMRNSYAVFCLKKKKTQKPTHSNKQ